MGVISISKLAVKAAKKAAKDALTVRHSATEPYEVLYHGSKGTNAKKLVVDDKPENDLFNGVFASVDKDAALSHGDYLYHTYMPENKILRQFPLEYELPYETTLKAFEDVTGFKKGEPGFDEAWKAVIEDQSNDVENLYDILGGRFEGQGEAEWKAQKLRGQVAKHLGYGAVEMRDEHGTSYLVTPGAVFRRGDPYRIKARGGRVSSFAVKR